MNYGKHTNTGSRIVRRKTAPGVKGGKVQRKNRGDDEPTIYSGPLTIRTEVPRWPNLHALREEDIHRFIEILPDWKELSRGLEEIVLADRYEKDVDGWYSPGTVALCAWPDGLTDIWPAVHYDEHREVLDRLGVPCERELAYYCHLNSTYAKELDARRSKRVLRECPPGYDDDLSVEVLTPSHEWALSSGSNTTVLSIVATSNGLDVYEVVYKCRFEESTVRAYLLLHIFLHELGHHYDNITTPYKGWTVRGEVYAEEYALRYEQQIWSKYCDVFGP